VAEVSPGVGRRPGANPLLELRGVSLTVPLPNGGDLRIVDRVDLALQDGERLALVGESGSGKSATARAILRLDPRVRIGGQILLRGQDLTGLTQREMARLRGRELTLVFQDPAAALDPLMSVGAQVMEPLRLAGVPRRLAQARARDLLSDLGVPDAGRRMRAHPHEFSGGMRQRVALAMALAGDPSVLIADEPTTALDVRAQEQVLTMLHRVAHERRLSVVLITHDLATVAGFADRVAVMYAGRVVHVDPVDDLFAAPAHPYSRGLLRALPRLEEVRGRLRAIEGAPPHPSDRPAGCVFHPRCPLRVGECESVVPDPVATPAGGTVACHLFTSPAPDQA
jgi:oligopeptide/dipeptide ABC transporter ATP-binding protein